MGLNHRFPTIASVGIRLIPIVATFETFFLVPGVVRHLVWADCILPTRAVARLWPRCGPFAFWRPQGREESARSFLSIMRYLSMLSGGASRPSDVFCPQSGVHRCGAKNPGFEIFDSSDELVKLMGFKLEVLSKLFGAILSLVASKFYSLALIVPAV